MASNREPSPTRLCCADFTVDSPQIQGLRNILSIAHDYDVGTISLPIILKELQSEVESSHRVRAQHTHHMIHTNAIC
jgi:hypothetical protein